MSSETDNQAQRARIKAAVVHANSAPPNGPDRKDPIGVRNEAIPKDQEAPKNTGPMPGRRNPFRTGFGALLFLAWGILTILWVASTIYSVANGTVLALVTAVCALALLVLLGAMEGLEVSVIDRWQALWPDESMSYLARWLAARQLFVALIVTAATLLANRSIIIIPGTSTKITDGFTLGVFDLTWTTLTVLWFAQIFPKHLGATNPDRYLERLRQAMFPVVEVVRKIGVSQPGEWTADVFEYWLDWPMSPEELTQRRIHKHSLGEIWCTLRLPHRSRTHTVDQSQPEK